ncbi:3-oxoacyl-[acyl-carrier-protein] reductase FabG-like [Liolophura sinensis]|uniref:3-oxoacyl-[acyl-carrier-protein] reductase FabG-like n=1 Tax=Liolophura sinensis TaxID=3198878 RepID=UPI003159829A
MRLAGKVALITGAARGIGKATAGLFLKNSAKVCVLDITKDELNATHTQLSSGHGKDNVTSFIADVTDDKSMTDAFKHTLQKFGKLNVVINNASILNESKMEAMLSINMVSCYTL